VKQYRSQLLLAAVVLIALAAWVLLGDDDPSNSNGNGLAEANLEQEASQSDGDDQLQQAETETPDSPAEANDSAASDGVTPEQIQTAPTRVDAGPIPEPGTVLIQIIDSSGNPVSGIQVAIGMQVPFEKRAVRVGDATSAGEKGIAAVKLNMEYLRKNAGILQNPELMADAKFPTQKAARIKFLLEDGQSQVQKLVVPDFHWLTAQVRHADGTRPDFPVSLQIYWGPLEVAENKSPWSNRRSIWQDFENGVGRFACEPDLQLWLTAKAKDGHCEQADLRTLGPAVGESTPPAYELVLGEDFPVFRSQFLLADGTPAADARIAFYTSEQRIATAEEAAAGKAYEADRARWRRNFHTDAEGVGSFPVTGKLTDAKHFRRWAFVLQNPDAHRSSKKLDDDGAEQVWVDLPNQLGSGEVFNPGPLKLQTKQLPILAAGSVIDADGDPLRIWVTVYGPDEKGSLRNRLAQERVGRDGSFTILGEAPAGGQIHVSTGGSGYLAQGQNVTAGTTGLFFQLERGINLKGKFKSDAPLPWMDMEVKIPPLSPQ
jgi:hypothetical protein